MPDVINYRHYIHPHTKAVLDGETRPTKTNDHRVRGKPGFARFNAKDGLLVNLGGQNIQAGASDKRAEDTYKDAEAVLHEAIEIQKHLASQDAAITEVVN